MDRMTCWEYEKRDVTMLVRAAQPYDRRSFGRFGDFVSVLGMEIDEESHFQLLLSPKIICRISSLYNGGRD